MSTMEIEVDVIPNSKKFEIKEIDPWTKRLKIKLTKPAQDNKANQELITKLSKLIGAKVEIKKGQKSSKKTILIHAKPEQVQKLFACQ